MTNRPEQSIEILRLLARGMRGPDIAKELHLSEWGARYRQRQVLAQLGARTPAHAVVIAAIDGLLTREDLRAAYEDRRVGGRAT